MRCSQVHLIWTKLIDLDRNYLVQVALLICQLLSPNNVFRILNRVLKPVMIYCGSSSDFRNVSVPAPIPVPIPVPAPAPVPDTEPEFAEAKSSDSVSTTLVVAANNV